VEPHRLPVGCDGGTGPVRPMLVRRARTTAWRRLRCRLIAGVRFPSPCRDGLAPLPAVGVVARPVGRRVATSNVSPKLIEPGNAETLPACARPTVAGSLCFLLPSALP